MKDYYVILGIAPGAEAEEVKAAFRRLAQRHHPDAGGTEEEFVALREAYDVLSDPETRSAYDLAYVEMYPEYGLVDADTGEELEVEFEDEPVRKHGGPVPDNGKGLLILLMVTMPLLAFGFAVALGGELVTALGVAAIAVLAAYAIGSLLRD